VNNYNTPVTLKWAFVGAPPAPGFSLSGSATLDPNDAGLCRSVTFTSTTTVPPGTTATVVLKGFTDPTLNPDFYAEVQFSANVILETRNDAIGGCP
jgi:hypothetical protein